MSQDAKNASRRGQIGVESFEQVERLLAAGVEPVDISVRSDSHAVKARHLLEQMILADQHHARIDRAPSTLESSGNTQ